MAKPLTEVWVLGQAMKRHKIKQAGERTVQACIDQLQAIVDGLKAGSIRVQHDEETVLLGPGGVVSFELRVEQTPRKETLRVELSWRPDAEPGRAAASGAVVTAGSPEAGLPATGLPATGLPATGAPATGGLPSTGIPGAGPSDARLAEARLAESSPPAPRLSERVRGPLELDPDRDGPMSTRTLDRLATAEYQRLYDAARTLGSDGQWHIDQDRLIVSLALAGVDPLTQQELYALALQADADGRGSMLSERVIEAIKQISQHPAPIDAETTSPPAENA